MPDLHRVKTTYWKTRRVVASPRAAFDTWLRPLRCRLARANPHRVFAIDLDNRNLGFFAHLNFCLPYLHFCDESSLRPLIRFSSPNYLDSRLGPSWFDYFFVNRGLDAGDMALVEQGAVKMCKVRSGGEMGLPLPSSQRYFAGITLAGANALFTRHVALRETVVAQVEAFIATHFAGRTPIALHFRGTDKQHEAPRVAWELCRDVVSRYLQAHPEVDCLFVASDERGFAEDVAAAFPRIHVCRHDDHHVSADGRPLHLGASGDGNNFHLGEDALLNCLLMSRCSALIKSASLLSAWACIFNPSLPTVLLNRPHREQDLWFPETEIARRSMDHFLTVGRPAPPSAAAVAARVRTA